MAEPVRNTWPLKVLVGGVLPVGAVVLIARLFPHQAISHVPLHSAVEAFGAFSALAMIVLLWVQHRFEKTFSSQVWIAGGFAGMGVLDGIHACVVPGNTFVWLHSAATLAGGVLFALVWLPDRFTQLRGSFTLPPILAVASGLIGLVSVIVPEWVPAMVSAGEFTPAARAINAIGGAGFLAAAAQ